MKRAFPWGTPTTTPPGTPQPATAPSSASPPPRIQQDINKPRIAGPRSYVEEAHANGDFRRILATTTQMQVVAMSIRPKNDGTAELPREIHPQSTQYIQVVSGHCDAWLWMDGVGSRHRSFELNPGDTLLVPATIQHEIYVTDDPESFGPGTAPRLQLLTIYAPPVHPFNMLPQANPPQ